MSNYPKLSNTPIKEIIFTISYSETIAPSVLTDFRNQTEINKKYNLVREGFRTHVLAAEGAKPETSIKSDGYILRCLSEGKVIQAREGSFAFHKMNIYEDFENLLSELLSLWDSLLACNKRKLSIRSISLRYLNFIEVGDGEEIDALVNVKPLHPFSRKTENYFMQLKFVEDAYQTNLITTGPVTQESKKGLVIDTIISKEHNNIDDYGVVKNNFIAMREIKNKVFFESITDYTLKKYL